MQQTFDSHQFTDADGNPAGGHTYGTGFAIAWQNGPLATDVKPEECNHPGHDHFEEVHKEAFDYLCDSKDDPCGKDDCPNCGLFADEPCRRDPNGAFVETIIAAAKDRIEFYERTKFACDDNAEAIEHLGRALEALQRRTKSRTERGVEGTHEA